MAADVCMSSAWGHGMGGNGPLQVKSTCMHTFYECVWTHEIYSPIQCNGYIGEGRSEAPSPWRERLPGRGLVAGLSSAFNDGPARPVPEGLRFV